MVVVSNTVKNVRRKKSKKGKKSLVTKNYLKNYLQKTVELKYRDRETSTTYNYDGVCEQYSIVPQSTTASTDSTRIGDKITLKNWQIRLTVAEADTKNVIRVIAFQYIDESDGVLSPTPGSILQVTGTYGIISPYRHDTRSSYIILSDTIFNLSSTGVPYGAFKLKVPLRYAKKQITYIGGSQQEGNNQLYLLIITDSSASVHPTVTVYSRIYFTDQ